MYIFLSHGLDKTDFTERYMGSKVFDRHMGNAQNIFVCSADKQQYDEK